MAQPGDTRPLSLPPSTLPPQEPFPQGGGMCVRVDSSSRVQEGK